MRSPGGEDPLEEEMVTHSSILAWERPWTEEPGRLQSIGSHRVRHNLATEHTWKGKISLSTSVFSTICQLATNTGEKEGGRPGLVSGDDASFLAQPNCTSFFQ